MEYRGRRRLYLTGNNEPKEGNAQELIIKASKVNKNVTKEHRTKFSITNVNKDIIDNETAIPVRNNQGK